jgi:hypothetical protein
MKEGAEKWVLLIFMAAVFYMLVRPSSPAPAAIASLGTLITNSVAVVAGG